MPRPSKHISPETLGGRIRAAREDLHLSLADVANGHYSTSLISQIERNRIEPSQESLRFLSERLHLPLAELEELVQRDREREAEIGDHKTYEELRVQASQLLAQKDPLRAIELLKDLYLPHIPSALRWRLVALRGQCYFEQRKFLKAQHDFIYAINELPTGEPQTAEQKYELLLLHMHLAGTYRELQQFDEALDHYKRTLELVGNETPLGYVAEVHWGMANIAYAQANQLANSAYCTKNCKEAKLRTALEHAENARFLYRSIGERLRAATVTCHIAQIEQTLGAVEKVRSYLEEILETWTPLLEEVQPATEKRRVQEIANIVSSAACSMAGIELDAHRYTPALEYVDQALRAGKLSYKLRRANAYLMRGRILEAVDPRDPAAEQAFRNAIVELNDTDRIAARISALVRLGRHLLKIGKIEEGELELERARHLSDLVSDSNGTATSTEEEGQWEMEKAGGAR